MPDDAPGPDQLALGFVAALRLAGVPVSLDQSITYLQALRVLGFDELESVRLAGRATLVSSPADLERHDAVFDLYWTPDVAGDRARRAEPVPPPVEVVDDADGPDERTDDGAGVDPTGPRLPQVARTSPIEVLRAKDFSAYTDADWRDADRVLRDVRLIGTTRRARRRQPARHGHGRPDLGATLRRAHRHGGEITAIRTTRPRHRPRRVVLVLDISGSMQPYERGLLRVAQAAVVNGARGQVEVFTLGTRLTRITRELTQRDPEQALAAVAAAVPDLSGGTRLGATLRRFNDRWSGGLARGAVVVIVSDGWERGDPRQLAAEVARLQRVAHRLVWVNPLKATAGYEPLARGIAAALPHVDRFVSGHSLDAIDELAGVLAEATARARPGASHDRPRSAEAPR